MDRPTQPASTVDRIAHDLSRSIVAGQLPAASQLPSVRALCERYDVNIATMQRVLSRLEALGLVRVRHGSGATVVDIEQAGGLELYPLTLEVAAREPARAARILADFLELRRVIALHSLFARAAELTAEAHARLAAAFEHFRQEARRQGAALEERARAEIEITRALVRALDQTASLYVLNGLERLLLSNRTLVRVAYADTEIERIEAAWSAVLALLARPQALPEAMPFLTATLESSDADLVARFERALTEEARAQAARARRRSPR